MKKIQLVGGLVSVSFATGEAYAEDTGAAEDQEADDGGGAQGTQDDGDELQQGQGG